MTFSRANSVTIVQIYCENSLATQAKIGSRTLAEHKFKV